VERVSWNDIQEFLKKLNTLTGQNYRLPTEAEWEFAARGGNQTRGYLYSGSNNIGEVGWYGDNSNSKTHPVGHKKANELGLFDMSGNVWEWCQDWYGDYPSTAQQNPKGPESGSRRVLRGGGWGLNAQGCRAAYRRGDGPAVRYHRPWLSSGPQFTLAFSCLLGCGEER
jgi:sulfatase modifying factor 1